MGKQNGKEKKQAGEMSSDTSLKQSKFGESNPKGYDNHTTVFISMSQELKEEGNKLFQNMDHEGAMFVFGIGGHLVVGLLVQPVGFDLFDMLNAICKLFLY
ncbi:hypothetical protein CJ030_MR1G016600 [Morella rubra]|uniref:Uncharacterized protein n=1 Tax=Morella rubra TaxID=262757 RepID=A0A6A1WL17_9ROSI|nr:hypothetical protein CJ030_MR1G016600 [Morella rubra]